MNQASYCFSSIDINFFEVTQIISYSIVYLLFDIVKVNHLTFLYKIYN